MHHRVGAEVGGGEVFGGEGAGVAVGEEQIGLGELVVAVLDAVGVGGVDVHEDAVEEEDQIGGALDAGKPFEAGVGIDAVAGDAAVGDGQPLGNVARGCRR